MTYSLSEMRVVGLRTEYRSDPLGLDETEPRLAWRLVDDRRGARQSAYQVFVTRVDGHGVLWDSAVVTSDETTQIVYGGLPLRAFDSATWTRARVGRRRRRHAVERAGALRARAALDRRLGAGAADPVECAVGEWLYRAVGGIDAADPGYRRVLVRPRPGGSLTQAAASVETHRGRIETAWRIDGDELTLRLVLPPNTVATVVLPAPSADAVTESGAPLAEVPGVEAVEQRQAEVELTALAGTYAVSVSNRQAKEERCARS